MRKNGHFSEFDDKKTEDFIWQKMSEAADAYEAELNADPLLDDVCLTPEMMEDMMQRIAEEDEKERRKRGTASLRGRPRSSRTWQKRTGAAHKTEKKAAKCCSEQESRQRRWLLYLVPVCQ